MTRSHFWCTGLLVAAAAHAQDSSCTRAPAVARVPVVIAGQVEPVYPTLDVPRPYLKGVLMAIRESLRISGPLNFSSYTTLGRRDTVTYSATATVHFQITRNGAIADNHLLASSLSRAFDSALVGAVARADSAQLVLPLPPGVGDRVHLRLTTNVTIDTTESASRRGVIAPLLSTSVPIWTSFAMPNLTPGSPTPNYPTLLAGAVSDSVLAIFVSDEKGVVVPGTAYIAHASYRDFAVSVMRWVYGKARYPGGMVGGCPAKFLIEQEFQYKLPRQP